MRVPFVVILCLAYILRVHGDKPLTYKSTNLECKINPKFAVNTSCLVKAKTWNKAVVNMECYILIPLRNVSVHLEVFKKGYNNRYHPFLINVDINMCDIIARRSYIPYGTIFWKILKEHTNANHSCPYSGHVIAKNMYIDASHTYVPQLPLGIYKFSLELSENYPNQTKEHLGFVKYYFQVAEVVQLKKKKT